MGTMRWTGVVQGGGGGGGIPGYPTGFYSDTNVEYPRAYVGWTAAPGGGTVHNCANASQFQTALDNAVDGDEIVITASFTGAFTISVTHDPLNPVTVRSAGATWGSSCLTNAEAIALARVSTTNATPVLTIDTGVDGWDFDEVAFTATGESGFMIVYVGLTSVTDPAQVPVGIRFNRCAIWAESATAEWSQGIQHHANHAGWKNGRIWNIKKQGADAQAILGGAQAGPFCAVNSYLEASGENIMFGGFPNALTGVLPSDIEVRYNYFRTDPSWLQNTATGGPYTVKNNFELKYARRVLFQGNESEYMWSSAGQSGHHMLFQVSPNSVSGMAWADIDDVLVLDNWVHDGNQFLTMLSQVESHVGFLSKVVIENNLITHMGPNFSTFGTNVDTGSGANAAKGRVLSMSKGIDDVYFRQNTCAKVHQWLYAGGSSGNKHERTTFVGNLLDYVSPDLFFWGDSVIGPDTTVPQYFDTVTFTMTDNVVVGQPTAQWDDYIADNDLVAAVSNIGYTDYAGDDFMLSGGSAYAGRGCDHTRLQAQLALSDVQK